MAMFQQLPVPCGLILGADRGNRMLLLQDTMAKKLNAELDEIEVGVYDFVAGQHYATKFKPSQIRAVQKRLFALLSEFGKITIVRRHL